MEKTKKAKQNKTKENKKDLYLLVNWSLLCCCQRDCLPDHSAQTRQIDLGQCAWSQ